MARALLGHRGMARFIIVCVLPVLAGCMSWTLGPEPDGGVVDGAADVETGDAPSDVQGDSYDCDAARPSLRAALAAAMQCDPTDSTQCMVSIRDECSCTVYVADAGSGLVTAYIMQRDAWLQQGCSCMCVSTPPTSQMCAAGGGCTP